MNNERSRSVVVKCSRMEDAQSFCDDAACCLRLFQYSLTSASASFVVKSGDRLGWTYEGSVGAISFTYDTSKHTYYQRAPISSLPAVGQIVQFTTVSLPSHNSAAILVNPCEYCVLEI